MYKSASFYPFFLLFLQFFMPQFNPETLLNIENVSFLRDD
jgi:hypothetical protein